MVLQTISAIYTDLAANITAGNYPAASVALGSMIWATDTQAWYVETSTGPVVTKPGFNNSYSAVPADPSSETNATIVAAGLSNGPGSSLVNLLAGYPAGTSTIALDSSASFYAGEKVIIGAGAALSTPEIMTIKSISSPKLTFTTPTLFTHPDEDTVIGSSSCITPGSTGRIHIKCLGAMTGANGDLVTAQLYIGSAITIATPAVNAAFDASAVAVGNAAIYTALTGALQSNFSCEAWLGVNTAATDTPPSGGAARTVGTPYYIDMGFKSSAGAAQLTKLTIFVEEF